MMKSVFDKITRDELIKRINSLNESSKAKWGKMNVYQMVKHCTLCEDMYQGNVKIRRVFIGRLIGSLILKQILKDDKPFSKNSPTSPQLNTTKDSGDLEKQKLAWISRIQEYQNYTHQDLIHPFFGRMTKEQVGLLDYKHIDHHLRQFGA